MICFAQQFSVFSAWISLLYSILILVLHFMDYYLDELMFGQLAVIVLGMSIGICFGVYPKIRYLSKLNRELWIKTRKTSGCRFVKLLIEAVWIVTIAAVFMYIHSVRSGISGILYEVLRNGDELRVLILNIFCLLAGYLCCYSNTVICCMECSNQACALEVQNITVNDLKSDHIIYRVVKILQYPIAVIAGIGVMIIFSCNVFSLFFAETDIFWNLLDKLDWIMNLSLFAGFILLMLAMPEFTEDQDELIVNRFLTSRIYLFSFGFMLLQGLYHGISFVLQSFAGCGSLPNGDLLYQMLEFNHFQYHEILVRWSIPVLMFLGYLILSETKLIQQRNK